jgi:hypothetical protein
MAEAASFEAALRQFSGTAWWAAFPAFAAGTPICAGMLEFRRVEIEVS